jgi:hypothetical protein
VRRLGSGSLFQADVLRPPGTCTLPEVFCANLLSLRQFGIAQIPVAAHDARQVKLLAEPSNAILRLSLLSHLNITP